MPATDILLIEDEPNIAEAVRFILTRDGWRLDHWSEGSQALALGSEHAVRVGGASAGGAPWRARR